MEFLTAEELARQLKVTVDTVWRYTRTGRIPCVRLGGRDYRYRLAEVLASLEAGAGEAVPPTAEDRPPCLRPPDPEKLRIFAGRLQGGGRL